MESFVADYLKKRKDNLKDLYQWPFDIDVPRRTFGITLSGESWLEKTTNLREALRQRIAANSNPKNHEAIAAYFIKDWGRIARFSKASEVVSQFSSVAESQEIPVNFEAKFQSISSWSKWASLICPKWACVYDTRVAYSLNAINFVGGGKHKIFPRRQEYSSQYAGCINTSPGP